MSGNPDTVDFAVGSLPPMPVLRSLFLHSLPLLILLFFCDKFILINHIHLYHLISFYNQCFLFLHDVFNETLILNPNVCFDR